MEWSALPNSEKSNRVGTDLTIGFDNEFTGDLCPEQQGQKPDQRREEYGSNYLYYSFKKFWGKGKETCQAINLRGGLY